VIAGRRRKSSKNPELRVVAALGLGEMPRLSGDGLTPPALLGFFRSGVESTRGPISFPISGFQAVVPDHIYLPAPAARLPLLESQMHG
jgi:hypothetical protein